MKHLYKILFSFLILFLWQAPVQARDNVIDWYIKDFQILINVNQDSSLDITEKILADCGTATDKHGIFRIFPKEYKTVDGNFILPLELISITDGKGNKLKYSVISDSGTITYKIGDSNIYVQGENNYEIKYRIKNTIRTGNKDFDELYWNVLGNYWDLEIDKFTAQINFPTEINKDNAKISYYTGILGSKESNLVTYKWSSNNILNIINSRTILRNEGVTISVTFPKNIITQYNLTFKDKYGFSFGDIIIFLFFPLLAFFISLKFWKKYGRDPHFKKTIIPEFEIPENLTPIEMGGLMDKGGLHNNATTATIIRLGVLGYLKIEKVEKKIVFIDMSDFKLIRTDKQDSGDLYEAEKYILNKLFITGLEVNLKDMKTSFYKEKPKISQIILNDFEDREFVSKAGQKYQKIMFVVGSVLFLVCFLFSYIPVILYSIIFAAGIVIIFACYMGSLTLKGAEVNWRIKGFKLYMNTAEKYRSRFQEQEGTLDKLLPYAILFGITKRWLEKMKDIYGDKYFENYHPAYLVGVAGLTDFGNFTSMISEMSRSISSNTSASSSGAGGGGSVGGGGGGGGGGGW